MVISFVAGFGNISTGFIVAISIFTGIQLIRVIIFLSVVPKKVVPRYSLVLNVNPYSPFQVGVTQLKSPVIESIEIKSVAAGIEEIVSASEILKGFNSKNIESPSGS